MTNTWVLAVKTSRSDVDAVACVHIGVSRYLSIPHAPDMQCFFSFAILVLCHFHFILDKKEKER